MSFVFIVQSILSVICLRPYISYYCRSLIMMIDQRNVNFVANDSRCVNETTTSKIGKRRNFKKGR